MMILGIDPSLTHTGLVLLNGTTIYSETFETNSKEYIEKRLSDIRNRISELLEIKKPDLCVIEGYAYHSFAAHSALLHELGGILKLLFYDANIPFEIITPMSLKKFACGKATKAEKSAIMLSVFKDWGFDPKTDHEADAFVLAKMGEYLLELKYSNKKLEDFTDLSAPRRDVLKNILKKVSKT